MPKNEHLDKVEAASSRLFSETKRQDAASTFFNPHSEVLVSRANLPHWRQNEVLYFVTFRLADSLPQQKLAQLRAERAHYFASKPNLDRDEFEKEYWERFGGKIEEYLEAGSGSCVLKNPDAAAIARDALLHFNGERYVLGEWVVASNHVHVLLRIAREHELSSILHSWKSFTSKKINLLTGCAGALWQKETYDHIVRGAEAQWRIEQYLREHKGEFNSANGA